jgi:hypothetical protein
MSNRAKRVQASGSRRASTLSEAVLNSVFGGVLLPTGPDRTFWTQELPEGFRAFGWSQMSVNPNNGEKTFNVDGLRVVRPPSGPSFSWDHAERAVDLIESTARTSGADRFTVSSPDHATIFKTLAPVAEATGTTDRSLWSDLDNPRTGRLAVGPGTTERASLWSDLDNPRTGRLAVGPGTTERASPIWDGTVANSGPAPLVDVSNNPKLTESASATSSAGGTQSVEDPLLNPQHWNERLAQIEDGRLSGAERDWVYGWDEPGGVRWTTDDLRGFRDRAQAFQNLNHLDEQYRGALARGEDAVELRATLDAVGIKPEELGDLAAAAKQRALAPESRGSDAWRPTALSESPAGGSAFESFGRMGPAAGKAAGVIGTVGLATGLVEAAAHDGYLPESWGDNVSGFNKVLGTALGPLSPTHGVVGDYVTQKTGSEVAGFAAGAGADMGIYGAATLAAGTTGAAVVGAAAIAGAGYAGLDYLANRSDFAVAGRKSNEVLNEMGINTDFGSFGHALGTEFRGGTSGFATNRPETERALTNFYQMYSSQPESNVALTGNGWGPENADARERLIALKDLSLQEARDPSVVGGGVFFPDGTSGAFVDTKYADALKDLSTNYSKDYDSDYLGNLTRDEVIGLRDNARMGVPAWEGGALPTENVQSTEGIVPAAEASPSAWNDQAASYLDPSANMENPSGPAEEVQQDPAFDPGATP